MRHIIATKLVRMARKLVFDEDILFVRDEETSDHVLNQIYHDVQSFLDRVRRNEGVETYTGRRDNGSAMEISIGIDDHEEKKAILRDTIKHAEKLGRRFKVKVVASEGESNVYEPKQP